MIELHDRAGLVYRSTSLFRYAKTLGIIPTHVGRSCVDCGNPATGYDHRDYRKPYDVVPICSGCNAKRGCGEPLPDDYDFVLYEIEWPVRPGIPI